MTLPSWERADLIQQIDILIHGNVHFRFKHRINIFGFKVEIEFCCNKLVDENLLKPFQI